MRHNWPTETLSRRKPLPEYLGLRREYLGKEYEFCTVLLFSAPVRSNLLHLYAFQCVAVSFILCYYLFKLYCAIKRI